MFPDVALFASRFRPACVEFDPAKDDLRNSSEDGVSQLGGIPFDLNTSPNQLNELNEEVDELQALHGAWRQSATEPDFWAAYLVGAFQPDETEDNDWDVEGAALGYTSTLVGISVIFRETVRDVQTEEPTQHVIGEEDLWRVVGLHEVGHQFGLNHSLMDDGPIMDYFSTQTLEVDELIFSPKGLQQITKRDFPRQSTPPPPAP
ncbi:MAG TPA: hypothetical protein VMP01_14570 [Pirellulaceae bacterium]|nr:hypothetical protein [Pirellulaceae bacterium]